MENKAAIILLLAMVLTSPGLTQSQDPINWSSYFNIVGTMSRYQEFDTRYQGIKGTPYYSEEWHEGTLELQNGVVVTEDIELFIDVYGHHLYARQSSGRLFQISLEAVKMFSLIENGGSNQFEVISRDGLKAGDGPLLIKILYSHDQVVLFKAMEKNFKAANYKEAYAGGQPYDQFLDDIDYFIRVGETAEKIKLNKSALSKIFPGKKKAIDNYIKDNNLSLNTETELIDVIAHIFGSS